MGEGAFLHTTGGINVEGPVFSVLGTQWCDVSTKDLDSFVLTALLSVSHMTTTLCVWLSLTVHPPAIFKFLGSPLHTFLVSSSWLKLLLIACTDFNPKTHSELKAFCIMLWLQAHGSQGVECGGLNEYGPPKTHVGLNAWPIGSDTIGVALIE